MGLHFKNWLHDTAVELGNMGWEEVECTGAFSVIARARASPSTYCNLSSRHSVKQGNKTMHMHET